MCGRFVASRPVEDIVEQFAVDDVRVPPELLPGPRFNVAPTDEVLAVRAVRLDRSSEGHGAGEGNGGVERRLGAYRWGLVPSWAKDPKVGTRAFNARAETLASKPMFQTALARRRCIVPADSFYEWQAQPGVAPLPGAGAAPARPRAGTGRRKLPWCFKAADGLLLGFAGLYEVWRPDTETEWLATCTIVTTRANDLMAPIHDRMPVVLRPDAYDLWLAPRQLEPDELAELLSPPPDDFLTAFRVGFEVSDSRSEGPQLAEPVENSA